MKAPSLAIEAAFVEHRKRLRKMGKYFFFSKLSTKLQNFAIHPFKARQWILN